MDNRIVYMDEEAQKPTKYDRIKKRKSKTPQSLEWVSSGKTTISLAALFCVVIMIVYMWQSQNVTVSSQTTTNPFLKWLSDSHSNHNLFPSHALFTASDAFHIIFLVRQRSVVEVSAVARAITSISEATNAHTAHVTIVQVGQQDDDVQRLINKVPFKLLKFIFKYKSSLFEHHVMLDGSTQSSDVYKEALKTGFAQMKQNLPRLSYTEVPSLGKDARDTEVKMAITNGNRKPTEEDFVKYVIVIQDNEVVSKDFFVVFQQLAPIFAADESVFSVSAYNELSRENFVKNKKAVHRMNHFSDHAWMISRRIYSILSENWIDEPNDGSSWLNSLAEKIMADKHMETLYPEVSRAKLFSESGIVTTNMEFVDLFGNQDDLGSQLTFSIVGLTKANYEWEIIQNDWIIPGVLMNNLNSLPDLLEGLKKNRAVLIYHDSPTHHDFYSKWQQLVNKVAKNDNLDKISSDILLRYVYNGLFHQTINGVQYVWIEQKSSFSNLLLKHQTKATLLSAQDFNL